MIDQIATFLTSQENPILKLAFFTAIIVIYSTFIFYFYRFLARKNIIELNLNQYNLYQNPLFAKILAAILFVIEYIILLPVLTFFWFAIFSILILILAKGLEVNTILLISAALIAAVRVTSYLTEDLAKDLAKMLPFTLLTIAITTSGFFNTTDLISRFVEIPNLFIHIPYYLLFIMGIEIFMRTGEFVQSVFQSVKSTEEESPIENIE